AIDVRQQLGDLVAGINEHAFPGFLAADNEAVLHEEARGARLDYHEAMILAVLDDLLFASKIRATAGQLGVTLTFAKSSAAALDEMRKAPPSLVIFDLNNPRTQPLETVAAMKQDVSLASVPIVGYVSHVDTTTIEAARAAGVNDVMARSAFAARLPEILSAG